MTAPIYSIRAWRIFVEEESKAWRLRPLANYQFTKAWTTGPVCTSPNGVDELGAGFWGLYPDRSTSTLHDFLHAYDPIIVGVIEHRGKVFQYYMGSRSDRAVVRYLSLQFPYQYGASATSRFGETIAQALQQLPRHYDCEVEQKESLLLSIRACQDWIKRQPERPLSPPITLESELT